MRTWSGPALEGRGGRCSPVACFCLQAFIDVHVPGLITADGRGYGKSPGGSAGRRGSRPAARAAGAAARPILAAGGRAGSRVAARRRPRRAGAQLWGQLRAHRDRRRPTLTELPFAKQFTAGSLGQLGRPGDLPDHAPTRRYTREKPGVFVIVKHGKWPARLKLKRRAEDDTLIDWTES